MKKEGYSVLVKKHKEEAADFVAEQEALVNFFNSPARKNWLKMIGLKKPEISKVSELIDHYAKLKITLENKKKPKKKKEIILIEDACLRLMFEAKLYRIYHVKSRLEKLKILEKILKSEYKDSVVLNTYRAEKLAVLSETSNMATDFLVFDLRNKKVIAADLERH